MTFCHAQLYKASLSAKYLCMSFQGVLGFYWLRPKFFKTYLKTCVTLIIVDGLMPTNITVYAILRWCMSLVTWRFGTVFGMTQEFLQCARIRRRLMNFAYPNWNHAPPTGAQALKTAIEVAALAKEEIIGELGSSISASLIEALESLFGSFVEVFMALFVPGKALQYTFRQCENLPASGDRE